jgi:hypothetical protein
VRLGRIRGCQLYCQPRRCNRWDQAARCLPPRRRRRSSTYHQLAAGLQGLAAALCGGRLLFVLEGGYEPAAVGESVGEVFLALLGRPSVEAAQPLSLPHPEPLLEVEALVQRLRAIHGLS